MATFETELWARLAGTLRCGVEPAAFGLQASAVHCALRMCDFRLPQKLGRLYLGQANSQCKGNRKGSISSRYYEACYCESAFFCVCVSLPFKTRQYFPYKYASLFIKAVLLKTVTSPRLYTLISVNPNGFIFQSYLFNLSVIPNV